MRPIVQTREVVMRRRRYWQETRSTWSLV